MKNAGKSRRQKDVDTIGGYLDKKLYQITNKF